MNEWEAHEGSYDHQHKKVHYIHLRFTCHILDPFFRRTAAVLSPPQKLEPVLTPSKRLKELSRMQRDPNATNKARERERKEDEKSGIGGLSFKPVKLGSAGDGAASLSKGFKKGGFRSAFGGGEAVVDVAAATDGISAVRDGETRRVEDDDAELESESEEDSYDPRRPTGCEAGCSAGK